MSANPLPFRPTEFAAEHDVFAAGAANTLSATLYGARTRAATAWLAVFGLVIYAPLAISSRNATAFAGLMFFAIACIARWVAGWMFERERAQAQPLMVCGLHAAIGIGWSAAGLASIGDGYGHGPTLVLLATAVIAAASVPMFERHRDACWWLLAPLAVLPLSLPIVSLQPWAWPLAAVALAALGAAARYAQQAQAQALQQLEAALRLKFMHAEWKKEQQAALSTRALLEARERDLEVLFEHAAVGIARVKGYVIEGVNDHLAKLLGKPADQWVRRDVLSLFSTENHAALDAIVKRQGTDKAKTTHERVGLATHNGALRPVEIIAARTERAGASGLWLVFDAIPAPAATATATATAAAASPAGNGERAGASASPLRPGPLDRAGLQRCLQTYADQRQRVTVVAVALTGLDALTQQHGDAAAQRVRDAIVQRLDAVCRAEDAVAMLDDACYAVLTAGEPSDLTLSLMCDRVHSAMATPHTLGRASVQLGASIESLRCELDVNKASTALAQIDEFATLARAARRRAAAARTAVSATPAPLMSTPPVEHNVARAPAALATLAAGALVANDVPALREDAALAARHSPPALHSSHALHAPHAPTSLGTGHSASPNAEATSAVGSDPVSHRAAHEADPPARNDAGGGALPTFDRIHIESAPDDE